MERNLIWNKLPPIKDWVMRFSSIYEFPGDVSLKPNEYNKVSMNIHFYH